MQLILNLLRSCLKPRNNCRVSIWVVVGKQAQCDSFDGKTNSPYRLLFSNYLGIYDNWPIVCICSLIIHQVASLSWLFTISHEAFHVYQDTVSAIARYSTYHCYLCITGACVGYVWQVVVSSGSSGTSSPMASSEFGTVPGKRGGL